MTRLGPALAIAAAVVAVALPAAVHADPPHTCGRILYSGQFYVVKAHRVTCTFAKRSAKTFLTIGAPPKGYKCRAAQGSVPVSCTHRVRKSRYFFATQVPA